LALLRSPDEGVLHLEDVMVSRTRMVDEQSDKGLGAVSEIAELAPLVPVAPSGVDGS